MKRTASLLALAGLLTFALVALRTAPPGPRTAQLSLLAVGDTGQPIGGPLAALRPQYQVARALAAEDVRAEVDGVVLLGDNFYPDGLEEDELKDRLRVNIVSPYCRFLEFTSRGRGSLADQCGVDPDQRHPVPLYAVLGNHDYGERESPMLQKEVVETYLKGWTMPDRVGVYDLPGGVSLILLQSMPILLDDGGERELTRALARSKGPWRIVAAHHPIADPGHGYDEDYAGRVRAAIAKAAVPVHLFLAGHEHNLQALQGEGGADVALHVVAGSGSDTRVVKPTGRDRLFAEETLGFVRVDRVGDGAEARLDVGLFAVPQTPGRGASRRATFAIRPDGQVDRR